MLLDLMQQAGLALPEGIDSRFDFERLEDFRQFLIQNKESFFSKADQERILERHLYESLIFVDRVASALGVSRETRVADAGTGPGLPGYLFACRRPAPRLTLIDSSARNLGRLQAHLSAVAQDSSATSPPLVEFEFRRLEEMKGRFHLITTRALFPFPSVLELICHLQKPGDHFALAGAELSIEDPRIRDYLSTLGYVSRETIVPPELEFLGKRRIYLFQKEKQTKKGYPRKWKVIKEAQQQWAK